MTVVELTEIPVPLNLTVLPPLTKLVPVIMTVSVFPPSADEGEILLIVGMAPPNCPAVQREKELTPVRVISLNSPSTVPP